MSEQVFKFKVEMTCEGCVGAVKKCLQKAFGDQLKSVDTDLTTKTVVIRLDSTSRELTPEEVETALKKSGKEVTKIE